jgi:hypothetical protein
MAAPPASSGRAIGHHSAEVETAPNRLYDIANLFGELLAA